MHYFESMIKGTQIIHLPEPGYFDQAAKLFLNDFRFQGSRLSLQHIAAISRYFSRLPWENVSKIIKSRNFTGETTLRMPEELVRDHFRWNLGGTCFSLTYFLMTVLGHYGYETEPVICHMNWGLNSHTAVVVLFNGRRYLVDPGYFIFTPLPLSGKTVRTIISPQSGVELRFNEEKDQYTVYTFRKGNYTRRFYFQDQGVNLQRYGQFWLESFSLPTMDGLCLTQVNDDNMIYIHNDYLKITSPDRVEKSREINRVEHLIRDRFDIPLHLVEEARSILNKRSTGGSG